MAFFAKFNQLFVANTRSFRRIWYLYQSFHQIAECGSISPTLIGRLQKDFTVLPGLRFNYDNKDVNYNRIAAGGLDTTTWNGSSADKKTLQGFKNGVYTSQAYIADADETNLTYQLTLAYRGNKRINTFVTLLNQLQTSGCKCRRSANH